MSFDVGALTLCVIDSNFTCVSSTSSQTKVFDLVKARSIVASIGFESITGLVTFIATAPFDKSMVSFIRTSFGDVASLATDNCDGFRGTLFNNRGNVLICTLFATPKRRMNVFRGCVFDSCDCCDSSCGADDSILFFNVIPLICGLISFVGAAGRRKLAFGIRVASDGVVLSKRGIFVCFSS